MKRIGAATADGPHEFRHMTMTSTDTQHEQTRTGIPPVEARQGVISGRVVTVLAVSLFLGIVAMAIIWFAFR
jgi:hypothetical protein